MLPTAPRQGAKSYHARIAANRQSQCDVPGCQERRQGFGRLCQKHDRAEERTGHPLGTTLRAKELKPYAHAVRSVIDRHRDSGSIEAARQWIESLLAQGRPHPGWRCRGKPLLALQHHLNRLRLADLHPDDCLATVAGCYLLREWHPRRFKSDRHFRHQLALSVLKLAAPRRKDTGHLDATKAPVGCRERLADHLTHTLGPLALKLARLTLPELGRPAENHINNQLEITTE